MSFQYIIVFALFVGVTLAQTTNFNTRLQLKSQTERQRDPIIKSFADNLNRQRFINNHQPESRTTIFFPGSSNPGQQQQQQQQIQTHHQAQPEQFENYPVQPIQDNIEYQQQQQQQQQQQFPKIVANVQKSVRPFPTVPTIPAPVELQQQEELTEEQLREQDENAHYSFDSSISDSINDHQITRQETRDGLSLNGMYSYSDGYFKRTVYYAADEDGYRVLKEEIEPIGDGPVLNPKGKADVSSSLSGSYSITAADINMRKEKVNKVDKV